MSEQQPKKKMGRPRKYPEGNRGLPDGWGRISFIVDRSLIEKLRAIGWDKAKTLSATVNNAFDAYIQANDPKEEIVKRYEKLKNSEDETY